MQRLTALRRIDATITSSLDLNVTLNVLLDHVITDLVISIASQPAPDGQAVEVVVADNGKGIDENSRAKIFTPFFTTKEPDRGNGLGLSVCQSIVQNHGGTISFESQAGQGTRFLVRLPCMA